MKIRTIFFIFIVVLIFGAPSPLLAASILAQSDNDIAAGDIAVVDVYLNTEGKTINSVEGSILLSGKNGGQFKPTDFSVGGSAFTLWPRKPSLSENGTIISFVGGVPNGVTGSRVRLFSVSLLLQSPGTLSILPQGVTAYLSDGSGTALPVVETASLITIGAKRPLSRDFLSERLNEDQRPPEEFEVKLSRDPAVSDGRKFLFFPATDTDSGISYYEVFEKGFQPVRSGETYVLINQESPAKATVTAYDYAGNTRTVVFKEKTFSIIWDILAGLGVLAIVLLITWIVMKKRNRSV